MGKEGEMFCRVGGRVVGRSSPGLMNNWPKTVVEKGCIILGD